MLVTPGFRLWLRFSTLETALDHERGSPTRARGTCGNRYFSPLERAFWRQRARFYATARPRRLEELGRLVGDTAQSAGSTQVNH